MPHNTTVNVPAQPSFQQGKQQRRQGNLAAAIECFRETIRLHADFVPAYNNLGKALAAENDFVPAQAACIGIGTGVAQGLEKIRPTHISDH